MRGRLGGRRAPVHRLGDGTRQEHEGIVCSNFDLRHFHQVRYSVVQNSRQKSTLCESFKSTRFERKSSHQLHESSAEPSVTLCEDAGESSFNSTPKLHTSFACLRPHRVLCLAASPSRCETSVASPRVHVTIFVVSVGHGLSLVLMEALLLVRILYLKPAGDRRHEEVTHLEQKEQKETRPPRGNTGRKEVVPTSWRFGGRSWWCKKRTCSMIV